MTRSQLDRWAQTPALAGIVAGVFVLALANRLLPVLRGAGLSSVLSYDDGVYYAAAVGFVHGRMPYRDFLLLHPPGVLLALAPIAALGRAAGEVTGWEASRLLWMLMGSCTALLVVRMLLPVGKLAAAVGGCLYAVFPGAVLVERTTLLEGLTNLCLVAALAVLIPDFASPGPRRTGRRGTRWIVPMGAGALLGFATTVKIWGAVPLLVVCIFAAVVVGARYGLVVLLGAVATATFTCLPFFLMAPGEMWRMVVLDQIGRDDSTGLMERAADILTMGLAPDSDLGVLVVLVGAGGLVLACLIAWRIEQVRVAVPILASTVAVLVLSPVFFPHYLGALAVPLALIGGAVVAGVAWRLERPRWRLAVLLLACIALAVDVVALSRIKSGEALPAELRRVVEPAPGCLTADDPNTLLALGVLGRNMSRGCQLVVDLGGHSHDLSRGVAVSRGRNRAWQELVVRYLGSGHYTLVTRFDRGRGLSSATAAVVESWPVRARAGRYEVRQPSPQPP